MAVYLKCCVLYKHTTLKKKSADKINPSICQFTPHTPSPPTSPRVWVKVPHLRWLSHCDYTVYLQFPNKSQHYCPTPHFIQSVFIEQSNQHCVKCWNTTVNKILLRESFILNRQEFLLFKFLNYEASIGRTSSSWSFIFSWEYKIYYGNIISMFLKIVLLWPHKHV